MHITNKTQTEEKNNNNLIQIVKGSVISIVLSLIILLIVSAIMTVSNISETNIPTIIIIVSAISILIGSIISTRKINKKGIINGGIVGAIYYVVLYITSSVIVSGFNLNTKSLIMLVASILAGIIGRNNRSKYKQKINLLLKIAYL